MEQQMDPSFDAAMMEKQQADVRQRSNLGGVPAKDRNQEQSVLGSLNAGTFQQASLAESMRMNLRQQKTMEHQQRRILDILTRHPEFEEFLEVLRSGLV